MENNKKLEKHGFIEFERADPRWQCCVSGDCEQIKQQIGTKFAESHRHQTLECEKCDNRKFASTTTLRNHQKRHAIQRPYGCTVPNCKASFIIPYELKKHMIMHSKEKRFECAVCSKRFTRPGSLSVHKKIHADLKPQFECTKCEVPKKFYWKSNFKAHLAAHFKTKISCKVCRRRFETEQLLEEHQKVHDYSEKFHCVGCERVYPNLYKLNYHLKAKHPNIGIWKCQYCDESFQRAVDLRSHVHDIHTHGKPYRCTFCQRSFLTQHNFRVHESRHHPSDTYECDICKLKFTYKRNIHAHMKKHIADANKTIPPKKRPRNRKMFKTNQHFCMQCHRGFAYERSASNCLHDPRCLRKTSDTYGDEMATVADNTNNNEQRIDNNCLKIKIDFVSKNNNTDQLIPLYELDYTPSNEHVERVMGAPSNRTNTIRSKRIDQSRNEFEESRYPEPVILVQAFTTPTPEPRTLTFRTPELPSFNSPPPTSEPQSSASNETPSPLSFYDHFDDSQSVDLAKHLSFSIRSLGLDSSPSSNSPTYTYDCRNIDEPIDYSLPKSIITFTENETQNVYYQL